MLVKDKKATKISGRRKEDEDIASSYKNLSEQGAIRVCSVVPGAVATRWWAGQEERMKQLSNNLLLQRIATPDDIAKLICSVLEQEAMTGQIVTVDSGQTL